MAQTEFQNMVVDLTAEIEKAYSDSPTMEEAEKLAARFLSAQIKVAEELAIADLDRRMRKRGAKAIRSAVRTEETRKHDKKPTEGQLDDICNLSEIVQSEEEAFDSAEVDTELLKNYLNVFQEAHIYFRGIAKNG